MVTECVCRVTHRLVLIGVVSLLCSVERAETAESEAPPPTAQGEQAPTPDANPPAEAGEVQERAIIRDHRTQPGTFTPSQSPSLGQPAPKVFVPGVTGPTIGTFAPPLRFTAPTENLTKVANAVQLRTKSLSTVVAVPPGLALTNPVNVRVTYKSPVSGNRMIQDTYNPATGYRKFHNDTEGNRQPRQMTFDILLTEQQPNNQPVSFSFTWQANLDPLFDVTVTPLRFKLNSDCDRIGKSEIRFSWMSPDAQQHKKSFSMGKGSTVTVQEFAWSRQEVGASANLGWPQWGFREDDPVGPMGAFLDGFGPPSIKLLPGTSGFVGRTIKEARGQNCSADTAFDITVSVRQYPNL